MTVSKPQISNFSALLDALSDAVRATNLFESVTLGDGTDALHRFPACVLVPGGTQAVRISSGAQQCTYVVTLILAVRSADAAGDARQLLDLRAALESALSGAVFAVVPGHFDTLVAPSAEPTRAKSASFVQTAELSVAMTTAEEA